jgi:Amt family ammonium transporter
VLAVGVFCVIGAFAIFLPIKYTIGIRMPEEDELRGLDISEHGMDSYHGFQVFNNQ